MERQRNRPPKEQENSSEAEHNEVEASNLSDTEFKVMVIGMLNIMKKDIETIKEGPLRYKECNI